MGKVSEAIERKLVGGLDPSRLEVIDDSDRHAGHAGAGPRGETHFNLIIEATAFIGLGRVQRQRLVHGLLAEELAGPVHALSLVTRAPGDA